MAIVHVGAGADQLVQMQRETVERLRGPSVAEWRDVDLSRLQVAAELSMFCIHCIERA
jgi:hypothetical protein